MYNNSKTAENMFDSILNTAGLCNLANAYSTQQLIQIANTIRPGRVQNVEQQRAKAGKQTKWNVTPAKLVLDWVYGIDTLIAPEGESNSKRFGFDVTLNPNEVKSKVAKLKDFAPLWKATGINKVAVVLLVVPNDFGIGLLTPDEQASLADELLEQLIYPMDEQSVDVRQYVLTV